MKRFAIPLIALAAAGATAQPADASWGVLGKLLGRTYVNNQDGTALTTRFVWGKDGRIVRQFGTSGFDFDWKDSYSRDKHDFTPIALHANGYIERSDTNGGMVTVLFMTPAGEFVEVECSHGSYTKRVHVPTSVRGASARSRAASGTGSEAKLLYDRIAAQPEATLGSLVPGSTAQSLACD